MSRYRYVILDPTGNLTALVLDPAPPADRAALTRELLKQSEQVAYLEAPRSPGAAAGIRLMGGEFCGNAAMASAAWLMRDEPADGGEKAFLLDVSGTAEPVPCAVRKTESGFEGTVRMPGVPLIREEILCGRRFTVVRMEGITHLVYEGGPLEKGEAEALLRGIAARRGEEAAGLMQWNRETREMLPLVYVRGSGSLVWEHGCGSGSAAVGALEAVRRGDGVSVTPVSQPGGTIRVSAEAAGGEIRGLSISGRIRLGQESAVEIPS